MYKPQDIMIGDWLLYKGMPHCVVGIMDDHLALKSPRENYCCGMPTFAFYKDVKPIPISPDYLKLFGFKQTDGISEFLEGNVWKITFDQKDVDNNEATDFVFSWTENEYEERSYRSVFRGYGDIPIFRFDAISDIQHFFYQESRCPMPLKLNHAGDHRQHQGHRAHRGHHQADLQFQGEDPGEAGLEGEQAQTD